MADFAYNVTFTRHSMFVPFQTYINFTETHEPFAPINKNALTNDPGVSAPGSFPAARAEGEAPGGAVTNGTSSLSELLPAVTLHNKPVPSEEVLIL